MLHTVCMLGGGGVTLHRLAASPQGLTDVIREIVRVRLTLVCSFRELVRCEADLPHWAKADLPYFAKRS